MQEFVTVDLCPRFDEALLRPWQSTADTLNRIEGEYRVEFLVRGVEVRPARAYSTSSSYIMSG